MGRARYHETVETSQQISLSWLKKWGRLKGWSAGTLIWSDGFNENSMGYEISLFGDEPYMRLRYSSTDYWNGKIDYDYIIYLVKTPCQLGGYRWWFICSYCCQKVTTLMNPGKGRYGCRRCLKLSYVSRRKSYHGRFAPFFRAMDLDEKYKKLRETVRKTHYRGSPTKKFRKLLRYKVWLDSVAPLLRSQIERI